MADIQTITGLKGTGDGGDVPKQAIVGNVIALAALGMMFGLIGSEVGQFKAWGDAMTPGFIGKLLLHGSTVIGAYVGGRLVPTQEKP